MKRAILIFLISPLLIFSQLSPNEQENGIYLGVSNEKLYPSLLGGNKFKKTGFAMLTFGVVKQDRIPFLLSSTSSQKVKGSLFEFRFGALLLDDNSIPIYDRAFRDAQSPKEFILLRLEPKIKKNKRYILKEKIGWRTRIQPDVISFKFEEVANGIFKVTTLKPLEKGEYAFVHQDILNINNFKQFAFFDFAVEE